MQDVGMTVAHEAAAWVVVDVAALCVELAGLEWHDIHIAIGEEGRAVGGAGGRGALSMRVNRMAQAEDAFLWAACVGWFALPLLCRYPLCVFPPCVSRFPLLSIGSHARHLPIAAVAAFLKACDDLPKVGLSSVSADNVMMHHGYKVQVFWHHHIILHLNHWIVCRDAFR